MYLCMLEKKKKALMYAPYIMKLIIDAGTSSPLVKTQLVIHKTVQPQKKKIHFDDDDDFLADDTPAPSSRPAPSPRRGPRMKNASTEFGGSSREPEEAHVKKPTFIEKTLMCMCIDSRKSQYSAYKEQRQMSKKIDLLIPEEERPLPPADPSTTLSYTAWNAAQGSTVDWRDLEEVTSSAPRDTGKAPMDEASGSGSDYSGSGSEDSD